MGTPVAVVSTTPPTESCASLALRIAASCAASTAGSSA